MATKFQRFGLCVSPIHISEDASRKPPRHGSASPVPLKLVTRWPLRAGFGHSSFKRHLAHHKAAQMHERVQTKSQTEGKCSGLATLSVWGLEAFLYETLGRRRTRSDCLLRGLVLHCPNLRGISKQSSIRRLRHLNPECKNDMVRQPHCHSSAAGTYTLRRSIYKNTCAYIYIYMYTCVYIYIPIHTCMYMYVCMYVCM